MLALRLGLGLVFLYAGFSIIANPTAWIGYVPQFVENFYPRESALILHAIFDLLLGAGLLLGQFLPLVSIMAFLNLTSILIFSGIDDITFRDVGLAFAALALFFRSVSFFVSYLKRSEESGVTPP